MTSDLHSLTLPLAPWFRTQHLVPANCFVRRREVFGPPKRPLERVDHFFGGCGDPCATVHDDLHFSWKNDHTYSGIFFGNLLRSPSSRDWHVFRRVGTLDLLACRTIRLRYAVVHAKRGLAQRRDRLRGRSTRVHSSIPTSAGSAVVRCTDSTVSPCFSR